MNATSLITDVADNFLSRNPGKIKIAKSGQALTFAGKRVQSFKSLGIVPETLMFNPTPDAWKVFHDHIFNKLKKASENRKLPAHLSNVKIVCDVLNGNKYVVEDGGVMPYDFDMFRESCDEEDYGLLYSNREHAVVAFNPNERLSWEEEIETPVGRKSWTHYNTYIPPEYTYSDPVTEFPSCEEFVRPFFELFLPREDERHYVLYWLHTLMSRRCEDILVLIGRQGNGKNTLMQLATILAGRQNVIIGSKAFGKEKFNSEVMRRKLVTLDEFSIKGAAKESLKCFANDYITVEAKGKDPQQIKNHCSFIIANNSMRSTDLEFKDRRFTCPELADRDLMITWGKDKIAKFKQVIDTRHFQREFPHWLMHEVNELQLSYPNQMNYITPHFYRLVESAKPEWFKEFKRQLKYKEFVTSQDIYKATRVRVSDSKILEELEREIEERECRGLKPHVIAESRVFEGRTQYLSKIYEGDESDDEPTLP